MKKAIMAGLLLFTSVIWGAAFPVQGSAMRYAGPVTFNGLRLLIGALFLIPVSLVLDNRNEKRGKLPLPLKEQRKISFRGGLAAGLFLFLATTAQQMALKTVRSGKVGFITALYIVLVPVFGAVIGRKQHKIVWFCAFLDITGFWFLSVQGGENLSVAPGDLVTLFSAACYAVQILLIERYTRRGTDAVQLTCTEFLLGGLLSLPVMFLTEHPEAEGLRQAFGSLLYAGIVSGGVGFTLQAVAQTVIESAPAALLMSPESVFSAVFGWLLLGETLSRRELTGCALVFAAVLLSQVPDLIAWRREKAARKGHEQDMEK